MKEYLFKVLLGLDLFASTLAGGLPGETLSGRAGTARSQGKLRGIIFASIIDFLAMNPNHCAEAVLGDIARAQAVIKDDSRGKGPATST